MKDPLQTIAENRNELMKRLLADWKASDDEYEKQIDDLEAENKRCAKRITEWEELICRHMNDKDDLKAENERLREESKIDQLIIKDLKQENEKLFHQLQGGTRGASSRWKEIEKLREENELLRKDIASWRKGECRRRIDRAMEGK